MRERDVVVAVTVGALSAPIGVVLWYGGAFFDLASLWPYPALMLGAGWFLARRHVVWPSRILGTLGLAGTSIIASGTLLAGLLAYLEANG